ncbi:hypothetical protein C8J56DRAFT_899395 [Mycena floridula]|nr:hypothetical protein C8J56DRAFT_899395 [Mycena floridula]
MCHWSTVQSGSGSASCAEEGKTSQERQIHSSKMYQDVPNALKPNHRSPEADQTIRSENSSTSSCAYSRQRLGVNSFRTVQFHGHPSHPARPKGSGPYPGQQPSDKISAIKPVKIAYPFSFSEPSKVRPSLKVLFAHASAACDIHRQPPRTSLLSQPMRNSLLSEKQAQTKDQLYHSRHQEARCAAAREYYQKTLKPRRQKQKDEGKRKGKSSSSGIYDSVENVAEELTFLEEAVEEWKIFWGDVDWNSL